MKDVNRVILVGRLGKDPVRKETHSGNTLTQFSLATSKNSGESKNTQWHSIVVWGIQGEQCHEWLKKGDPVYLEGCIRTDHYEDSQGNRRKSTEIWADLVSFLRPSASGSA